MCFSRVVLTNDGLEPQILYLEVVQTGIAEEGGLITVINIPIIRPLFIITCPMLILIRYITITMVVACLCI